MRSKPRANAPFLQVGHHHGRDGEHEAAHHLLCVLGAARVGEADEGAVDGDPGAPLQLEHQPAHAEHHAQQVHVVRRGVLQRRVALGGGRLVPCNPRGPPRVRHCGWSALTSGAATGSAQL